jgi:hypothetical protein
MNLQSADFTGQFDMKDIEQIKQQLDYFERWNQQALDKPESERSAFEQVAVEFREKGFAACFAESQSKHRNRISPVSLGKLLSLSRKALLRLPLSTSTPFVRTEKGMRQTLCFNREDIRRFLTSLNPAFSDYDFAGPLLAPEQVVEVFKTFEVGIDKRDLIRFRQDGDGPEFIALNSRVVRYRLSDVLGWIENPKKRTSSLAQSIMEA